MTVLLDRSAPQFEAVIALANQLLKACRAVNAQVMLANETGSYQDGANTLSFALQAVIDAGLGEGLGDREVFSALAVANASFARSWAGVAPEEVADRLAKGTRLALRISEDAPVYDLSAGGHA